MTLTGITWDHPRAYRPLEAFGSGVRWDRQSLEAFEAHPIAELAARYDLLVIDHPGLGAAIAAGALSPLDELVDATTLRGWQRASVGPTWRSYELAGRAWAVPVDAATQVVAWRPDRLDAPPATWPEVVEAAKQAPTTLCLGGPHALLDVLALAAGTDDLLDGDTAVQAIDTLREVWAISDQQVGLGNPIDVHEAMSLPDGPALCPLVYGYASYARPGPGRHPLRWADPPEQRSVLGGTGLAVSARANHAEVQTWLTAYLHSDVQAGLVPDAGGQPAAAAAWNAPSVDAAWGGYYSATRSGLEAAHIRPRINGWIQLQAEAADLVRAAVVHGANASGTVARINDRYRRTKANAR